MIQCQGDFLSLGVQEEAESKWIQRLQEITGLNPLPDIKKGKKTSIWDVGIWIMLNKNSEGYYICYISDTRINIRDISKMQINFEVATYVGTFFVDILPSGQLFC